MVTTMKPRLMHVVLAVLALAASTSAHVTLLAPNGGEVLRAGSTTTIRWREDISHFTLNWDIDYSVTGPNGPWIAIARDLPHKASSYVWYVPAEVRSSKHVRVRITQDNPKFNFDDISDADLAIVPSLTVGKSTPLSVSKGGYQSMQLDAGPTHAGAFCLMVGSLSGTSPGLQIGGFHLPLNPDAYFAFTQHLPGRALMPGSLGVLDAQGRAHARLVVPPRIVTASLAGHHIHHAFVVFDPKTFAIRLASNAITGTFAR